MKLTIDQKQKIQWFVYFLFKGTLDSRLIFANYDYKDKLLNDPALVYNCFEIFAFAAQARSDENLTDPDTLVADYILDIHTGDDAPGSSSIIERSVAYNRGQKSFWNDFLNLARCFCFSSFPDPLQENSLLQYYGNGTDAVPPFAVWSNVIEVDEQLKPLNSEYALKRANMRMNLWDDALLKEFEEWELEQEIY
jgi:hypothetical protein